MIHEVEDLGAEFNIVALGDLSPFRESKINLRESRTAASVSTHVAITREWIDSASCVVWRNRESIEVYLVKGHAVVGRPNRLSRNQVGTNLVDAEEGRRHLNREGQTAACL